MKRLTVFGLVCGVLCMVGLVAYATMAQAHGSASFEAWLAAQRQSPSLWALDAAALYTMVLSASCYGQHAHARSVGKESSDLRSNHQAQLEAMIANTAKFEEVNAEQADQISDQQEQLAAQAEQLATQAEHIKAQAEQLVAQAEQLVAQEAQIAGHTENMKTASVQITTLQVENYTQSEQIVNQAKQLAVQADRITAQSDQITEQLAQIDAQAESIKMLSGRNAALRAEIEARQEAFAVETRRLTEQAFRAMAEQVDLNTRQLETVNRMLQYHQDELHKLRQERVVVVSAPESARLADTGVGEPAALAAPATAVAAITAGPDGAASSDSSKAAKQNVDGTATKQPTPASSGWQRKL